MRIAYFSYLDLLNESKAGQECASAAMIDGISELVEMELWHCQIGEKAYSSKEELMGRFKNLKDVKICRIEKSNVNTKINILDGLLPLSIIPLKTNAILEFVNRAYSDLSIDIIHFDMMFWLAAFNKNDQKKKAIFCSGTDAYSLAHYRMAKYEKSILRTLRDLVAAYSLYRFEKIYFPKADIIHMFSSDCTKYISQFYPFDRIKTINMPIEDEWFSRPHEQNGEYYFKRIVMSGPHAYPWYCKGVLKFLKEIWPLVIEKHPSARLTIHSTSISPEVINYVKNDTRIILKEKVAKFEDIFLNQDYYIHPLLSGTGQKNRLAIAMAKGLCCIATNAAISGMEMTPMENYVPMTNSLESIKSINAILHDSNKTAKIASAGRTHIKNKFNTEIVAGMIFKEYKSVLKKTSKFNNIE